MDDKQKKAEFASGQEVKRKRVLFTTRLRARIRRDPQAFRIYSLLRILVIISLVRRIYLRDFESAAVCVLALLLLLVPAFTEWRFRVEIPAMMQITIYLFIYAAEILGELNQFYVRIPGWDTMLHTINGFICAAIGFSLIYVLNRGSSRISLSPFYLTLVGFTFSMTIGVIWEFIECFADLFFQMDMQKDFIVQRFSSVTLDPSNSQIPVHVNHITKTIIETKSGKTYTVYGGYLDIGLLDTMKDLFVNFIGALVFSIFGYSYLKHGDQGKPSVAEEMMLKVEDDEEADAPADTEGG